MREEKEERIPDNMKEWDNILVCILEASSMHNHFTPLAVYAFRLEQPFIQSFIALCVTLNRIIFTRAVMVEIEIRWMAVRCDWLELSAAFEHKYLVFNYLIF
jgi:hypothetical protein